MRLEQRERYNTAAPHGTIMCVLVHYNMPGYWTKRQGLPEDDNVAIHFFTTLDLGPTFRLQNRTISKERLKRKEHYIQYLEVYKNKKFRNEIKNEQIRKLAKFSSLFIVL